MVVASDSSVVAAMEPRTFVVVFLDCSCHRLQIYRKFVFYVLLLVVGVVWPAFAFASAETCCMVYSPASDSRGSRQDVLEQLAHTVRQPR